MKKLISCIFFLTVFSFAQAQDTIRLERGDTSLWNPEYAGFRWIYDEVDHNIIFTRKIKPGVYQIYHNQHHVAELTYVSRKEYLICMFEIDSNDTDEIASIEYFPYFRVFYTGDPIRYMKRMDTYRNDIIVTSYRNALGLFELSDLKRKDWILKYIKNGRMDTDIGFLGKP